MFLLKSSLSFFNKTFLPVKISFPSDLYKNQRSLNFETLNKIRSRSSTFKSLRYKRERTKHMLNSPGEIKETEKCSV